MRRTLAITAIALLFVAVVSGSFLSYGDTEVSFAEESASIADQIEEVALDPSIIALRRRDQNEDEAVLRSFEDSAALVEATIQKPRDPEMVEHLKALEALEAEVEADQETENQEASLLEANPVGYSPALLARVNEALRANDAQFGIADMAKPAKKKVFPKIGKGEKVLASEIPLAKAKDYMAEALNLKRRTIGEAEDMANESAQWIKKWEKDNGGHWCKKAKVKGAGKCTPKPALKKAPIPGAKMKKTKAQKKTKLALKAKKAAKRAAKKQLKKKMKKAAKKAKKALKKAGKKPVVKASRRRRRAGLLRRIGRKIRRM